MLPSISKIIKEWKDEAGVKGIIQVGAYVKNNTLRICTDKPGWMIGRGGEIYNKYIKKLNQAYPEIQEVEFIETDRWYIR